MSRTWEGSNVIPFVLQSCMINRDALWEHLNQSSQGEFIFSGVFDRPHLEMVLFTIIFFCYTVTLLGNTTIIVLSQLVPNLRTPMYFFLSNLSFVDLCYTTSIGPQMLVNFWREKKTISYAACGVQLSLAVALGATECILLAVMAYDRYAAVCQPLRYTTIMSHSTCFKMAAVSWVSGFIHSLVQTAMTLKLSFCGHNRIDNFFCEVPALLKLSCVDTSVNEAVLLGSAVVILLLPLSLIIVSYCYITVAVLRMHSAKGWHKAFHTCASHFTVVFLFYGSAIFSYLQPPSKYSRYQGKLMSLFYTMVAPMLNPLIYTLRNKEVHRALRKVMGWDSAV